MRMKLLLVATLTSLFLSNTANAARSGGAFTPYQGLWQGYHWTLLSANEQGGSSAAFLNATGYRANPNCNDHRSGTLVHPAGVGWYWPVCRGLNSGIGRHWAIINQSQFNLSGSSIRSSF